MTRLTDLLEHSRQTRAGEGKLFHGHETISPRPVRKMPEMIRFPPLANTARSPSTNNESSRNERRYVKSRRWNSNCFHLLSARVGIDREWRYFQRTHCSRIAYRLATIADAIPFHRKSIRFEIILSFLFLSAKTTKRNLFVPIFMKNCIHLRIFGRVRECLNEKCFRPTVFSVKIFPGKFDSDSERITIRYQAIGYESSRGNERYLDSYWFSMLEIRIRVTGLLLHSVNV